MEMTTSCGLHKSKSEHESTIDQSTDLYCCIPTETDRLQNSLQSGHHITQGFLVAVLFNPFKEAGNCSDLSLQGTVAGQTVTMRATVNVQLLTLTKFVKLIQKIILLNSEQFEFLTFTC